VADFFEAHPALAQHVTPGGSVIEPWGAPSLAREFVDGAGPEDLDVYDLGLIRKKGLCDCLTGILAHEVGHHVRYPGTLAVHARMRMIERSLLEEALRRHGGSVSASVERREGKLDLVIRS
jgi:hypothetical protein